MLNNRDFESQAGNKPKVFRMNLSGKDEENISFLQDFIGTTVQTETVRVALKRYADLVRSQQPQQS